MDGRLALRLRVGTRQTQEQLPELQRLAPSSRRC